MCSRTILLTAASLAVAGMADNANAVPAQNLQQMPVPRALVSTRLQFHHYHLLSDPHFVRGHYVAKSINPFGRVVLVEINPRDGALMGEILI